MSLPSSVALPLPPSLNSPLDPKLEEEEDRENAVHAGDEIDSGVLEQIVKVRNVYL